MTIQNSVWGPPLWRILHTLAEHLGALKHPFLEADEVRYWIQLLRSIEDILPCSLCQTHYRAWRKSNPLDAFSPLRKETLRNEARRWLWSLHQHVNQRRDVAGVELAAVSPLYKNRTPRQFQEDLATFHKVIQEAMMYRIVSGGQYREFRTRLTLLQGIIGFV